MVSRIAFLYILACISAPAQLKPSLIYANHGGGPALPKTIALTFDDGGAPGTLELAKYLTSAGIRATFFINGCRFKGQPPRGPYNGNCDGQAMVDSSLIDALVSLGHFVGNHTENHVQLPTIPKADQCRESVVTQQLIDRHNAQPHGLKLFRPPYFATGAEEAINSCAGVSDLTGPFGAEITGTGTINGIPIPGDYWCLPGYALASCGELYVQSILSFGGGFGGRMVILLIHDRGQMSPDSPKPLELVKYILNRLSRPEWQYVGLDVIEEVYGNAQMRLPARVTDEFGQNDGSGPVVFGKAAGKAAGTGQASAFKVRGDSVWGITPYTSSAGTVVVPKATRWLTFPSELAIPANGSFGFADFDGDGREDLWWDDPSGIVVALSTGHSFSQPHVWLDRDAFRSADGQQIENYRVLTGDIHGTGQDSLLFVTGHSDIFVAHPRAAAKRAPGLRSTAKYFPRPERWGNGGMSLPSQTPISQLAIFAGDIDGDGKADLCYRSAQGVQCGLSDGAIRFRQMLPWTPPNGEFSDAAGFADSAVSKTLALVNVMGTGKLDIAARTKTGIVFAESTGKQFVWYRHLFNQRSQLGALSDAPVAFADVSGNGKDEAIWTGPDGLYVARVQLTPPK